MRESYCRMLQQLVETATDGRFGEAIAAAQSDYDQLGSGVPMFCQYVRDFWNDTTQEDEGLGAVRSLACQLMIVAYREARRQDDAVSRAFLNSFTSDFPGIPESSLLPRWNSLTHAALAFREVAHSENRLLVWQQTSRLFQAYNEFIDGLLAYLVAMWRAGEGRPVDLGIFSAPYRNKTEQFTAMTGGENGAFYLFLRLARPAIRNAIAHERCWLDSEAGMVRYIEGKRQATEKAIDIMEFSALAAAGSHIGPAYLAAIATLAVLEDSASAGKQLLPAQLVKLFYFEGA